MKTAVRPISAPVGKPNGGKPEGFAQIEAQEHEPSIARGIVLGLSPALAELVDRASATAVAKRSQGLEHGLGAAALVFAAVGIGL